VRAYAQVSAPQETLSTYIHDKELVSLSSSGSSSGDIEHCNSPSAAAQSSLRAANLRRFSHTYLRLRATLLDLK